MSTALAGIFHHPLHLQGSVGILIFKAFIFFIYLFICMACGFLVPDWGSTLCPCIEGQSLSLFINSLILF